MSNGKSILSYGFAGEQINNDAMPIRPPFPGVIWHSPLLVQFRPSVLHPLLVFLSPPLLVQSAFVNTAPAPDCISPLLVQFRPSVQLPLPIYPYIPPLLVHSRQMTIFPLLNHHRPPQYRPMHSKCPSRCKNRLVIVKIHPLTIVESCEPQNRPKSPKSRWYNLPPFSMPGTLFIAL